MRGGSLTPSEPGARTDDVRLIDLRSASAHRRDHPRGAVSIPAPVLARSLFLLPPRDVPILVFDRDGERAREAGALLAQRGWTRVGWLDGSPRALGPDLRTSGIEPNRIWEPAPLLRRIEHALPRGGPSCDLACGSGRNTVFLALGGRDVLGVDLLPDALRQARALARAARIPPPGRVAFRGLDLSDAVQVRSLLRPARFRLLICFRYLERELLPRLPAALDRGGVVVYETFLEEQGRVKGKPSRPEFLLRPGELRMAFSELEIIHDREGLDSNGDWTASIVARRPI